MLGDEKGAAATQLEFLRNLGIPVPKIKNFYHYTNKEGATAIARCKKISASSVEARDATYGRGVYFTSMDPRHFSKEEIRENNYGNSAAFPDRTDYVVEVWMPWNHMHRTPDTRDIYLYANDVELERYTYNILKI
ncbi:uncharacterized protein LOC116302771 [Actinia tenebrosa]|uniref:Uncharacterized protein LOC116302771 n=1 Tax=Actinia tenebrosa TaxID=6105 RepID=A0A6P8IN79_ACTTE|nr:uncharacterized protein LOC116302771 [Actinia tenebrosa]